MSGFKTWIEIDRNAVEHNVRAFRKLIGPNVHPHTKFGVGVKLWAVVKSNAYGHGLILFSKLLNRLGVQGFCVDSVVEGLKLRQNGIRKPILVLGPTLGLDAVKAAKQGSLTLSVSSPEGLALIRKSRHKPDFHLKIDTGMHRQGFSLRDLVQVAKEIQMSKFKVQRRFGNWDLEIGNYLQGVYTHFAMPQNRQFTEGQFRSFQTAVGMLEAAGFKNLVRHASATGGAIVDPKYHLDAVRIGTGLQGILPISRHSRESGNLNGSGYGTNSRACPPKLERRRGWWNKENANGVDSRRSLPSTEIGGGNDGLKPVLSWHALVSEVKTVPRGAYVGYDCTERLRRNTKLAVIPIGYWHGYDRGLSGRGEVLIRGRRARVVGRVSMDLTVADATGIPVRVGDTATFIGRQGKEEITAAELAERIGTSHYEVLTRLNPLIERIVKSNE